MLALDQKSSPDHHAVLAPQGVNGALMRERNFDPGAGSLQGIKKGGPREKTA
jgi:hypothetical protein